MKKHAFLLVFVLLCLASGAVAQFSTENVITTNATNVLDVFRIDLNNDSLVDVLSASSLDNKVAWYQNLGNGSFSNQIVISTSATSVQRVHAGDLTGDGLPEVVAGISGGLIWYENVGGGNFGNANFINNLSLSSATVFVADINNDSLNDIIVGIGATVLYHLNMGNNNFGGQQNISTSYAFVQRIYLDHFDNDNLIDLVVASFTDDKIGYHKNLGNGSFGNQVVISTNIDGAIGVFGGDLNQDTHVDIVAAAANDDKISWFINDGSGSFGPENFVTDDLAFPSSVYADDLDNDGDNEILYTSQLNGKVGYFENMGSGSFPNSRTLIDSGLNNPRAIITADIDQDADVDVLVANRSSNKIAWYENLFAACPVPYDLQAVLLNSVKATLNWDAAVGPQNFEVIGGIVGHPTIYTLDNGSNDQLELDNLFPEASYWWQVRSTCPDSSTALSQIDTFKMPEFCESPTGFFTSFIPGTTSAILNWTVSSNSVGYIIAGRLAGSPVNLKLYAPAGTNSITVHNLMPCTNYEWRMVADCGYEISPLDLGLSPVVQFTSPGCSQSEKAVEVNQVQIPIVAPNPTSGHIEVRLPKEANEVQLFDLTGKMVMRIDQWAGNSTLLDLSHLNDAMYIIRIASPEALFIERIVLQGK